MPGGFPVSRGERKTNAPAYLTQRIGAMAIEAAAQAAAQSETTTVVSDTGTASSSVTGDAGKYILGKTASGGSQEVAQWLRERQAQNFDAVFVPAGIELAIHVDHELPIDFHANGRKLHHGTSLWTANYPKTLALGWISLALIGCTSTKESVLPQDGPTMQALYEQHMTELYPPAATTPGGRTPTPGRYRALPRFRPGGGQRDRVDLSPPAQPDPGDVRLSAPVGG